MNFKEITDFKELIKTKDYDFLRENKYLGDNLLFLTLGGSYAYGTNKETGSDVDIRGVAANTIEQILLGKDYEQVVDVNTDTVIYSLNKIFDLLAKCNPNTIELLGTREQDILFCSPLWQEVLDNKEIFLSKRAVQTFGGYANDQLRRLETKSARQRGQEQREKYIFESIQNAEFSFDKRLPEDVFRLHIEESDKEDFDTEIMIDVNLKDYPLRDFYTLISQYNSIIRGYDKIGKRNKKAIEHDKIAKHMMHLIRLYYMAFDILEKHEINTYRSAEHDYLMGIRNGKYIVDDHTVVPDFYKVIDELNARLEADKVSTTLPENPNMDKIGKFYCYLINKYVMGQ